MANTDEKTAPAANRPDTQPAYPASQPDTQPASPAPQAEIPPMPPAGSGAPATDIIVQDVETLMREMDLVFDQCTVLLTPEQRKSLVNSQVRNHGFIDVAFHSATDNPTLVPAYYNMKKFNADHADFENKARIFDLARKFYEEAADSLAVASDAAYHDALKYYEALKSEARNLPGAVAERDKLAEYFKRGSYHSSEPTEKQVERDVRSLLHGTKDGRVVIEHATPHASGGVHAVVDEVAGGHAEARGTIDAKE